jgi:hypothetical protein
MGIIARISNHINRQGKLMSGMMDRLMVDVDSLSADPSGHQIERAARACMFCTRGKACAAWQAAQTGAASQAPHFCPNRAFWASLGRI